jgi:hypothetical protein
VFPISAESMRYCMQFTRSQWLFTPTHAMQIRRTGVHCSSEMESIK